MALTHLWMTVTHMSDSIEAIQVFVAVFVKNILLGSFGNFHIPQFLHFGCALAKNMHIFPSCRLKRRHFDCE